MFTGVQFFHNTVEIIDALNSTTICKNCTTGSSYHWLIVECIQSCEPANKFDRLTWGRVTWLLLNHILGNFGSWKHSIHTWLADGKSLKMWAMLASNHCNWFVGEVYSILLSFTLDHWPYFSCASVTKWLSLAKVY